MHVLKNLTVYGLAANANCLLIEDNQHATLIPESAIPSAAHILENNDHCAVLPGWLDSHIHGGCGHDFADDHLSEQDIHQIARSLGKAGVAFCMPTLVSRNLSALKVNLHILDQYIANQEKKGGRPGIARLIGIHLEGPFIAKNCCGAHDSTILQTKITREMVLDLINAAPHVKAWKITLAPELEGAIQFINDAQEIAEIRNIAINIFIGHTNADRTFLQAACDAGVVGFTHLGNANGEEAHRLHKPLTYRHLKSNVVRYALDEAHITLPISFELIADGHHLSKEFVNFALTGREHKVILVTDALGPTGLADGLYHLGTRAIEKKGDVFYLQHQKTLAGSAATFANIVEKFSEMISKKGEALWTILYYATVINPRNTTLGSHLLLNNKENFVVLNETGKLILSVCNGRTFHHDNPFVCQHAACLT